MSRIAATSDLKEARMTVSTSASSGTRVRAWAKRSLALGRGTASPGFGGTGELIASPTVAQSGSSHYTSGEFWAVAGSLR